MGRLEGKSAIVTGGAGGIGKATAERFLKEGARVAIVDLGQAGLADAANALRAVGEILVLESDVTQEDQVANYVSKVLETFGTIDVFFNNAGIEGGIQSVVDVSLDDFERVQAVNLRGVFLGLKHVLPTMIAAGSGSVINMSSNGGLDGTPNLGPYIASKHGVTGLTKTAALEVAQYGVRVNSVHPCPVETRMMRSIEAGFSPSDVESAYRDFAARIPLGRYAKPEEVASLVLFLASDESSFITGSQYRIDGGMGATP